MKASACPKQLPFIEAALDRAVESVSTGPVLHWKAKASQQPVYENRRASYAADLRGLAAANRAKPGAAIFRTAGA